MTAAFATVLALVLAPARAPTPDEARLFDEGMAALRRHDGRAAEKAFQAGWERAHHPAFLVRIGEAQEQAGAPAEAVASYRRYLRDTPAASDRADVEARILRLQPAGPPADAAADVPRDLGGQPGGAAPGPAPPPAAASDRSAQASDAGPPPDDARPAGPPSRSALSVVGWSAVAAGVVAMGVAGFFGASAAEKRDDINRLQSYRDEKVDRPLEYADVAARYEAAWADGRRLEARARTAALLGGGLLVAGVALLVADALTSPGAASGAASRAPRARRLALSIGPGGLVLVGALP